jgi:hypothetical protein
MKRSKPTTLPLGTISEGTLRPEDLIPAYLDALSSLRLSKADRARLILERRAFQSWQNGDHAYDDAAFVDELTMMLENYCPDYAYFGSLEGEGACFGVWPVQELFTDTHQGSYDGFVYRANDTEAMHAGGIPTGYSHVLSVNDHGNVTLYRRAGNRWIKVWSVV